MSEKIKTGKISKTLPIIVEIGMLFGGAWFVCYLFSQTSMNILQLTEHIHYFTTRFIIDVSLDFVFQISLAVMLIISPILGVSKFLNFLWNFTGGIYVINVLYSIYKYFFYSVNFFKNYNFSFDGILKIFEFLLYLSFVCSLALICLYCGNVIPQKDKKIVVVFSFIGIVYLFSVLVISLFKSGGSAYLDIVKNSLNFITYGLVYSYGFIIEHTPKNKLFNDEKTDIQTEEEALNLDKITMLIEEIEERDSNERKLESSEFEKLNDVSVDLLGKIKDELSSNDEEFFPVDADLPLMGEEFSFEKDESIINNIIQEFCGSDMPLDNVEKSLLLDGVPSATVDGPLNFELGDNINLVEFTLSSDEDE